METIKINEIKKLQTKKGKDFWVIAYEGGEATIGQWDNQLADYIEKDVGIGGTVSVLIEQKGEYTNITKVDMNSGVKGDLTGQDGECMACGGSECDWWLAQPKPDKMMYSDKDRSIIAQCLPKVFLRNMVLLEKEPKVVLDAYNYFLEEL